jgi:hypothetical protein
VQGKDGSSCSILTLAACRAADGNWAGPNTVCANINCDGECPCDWNNDGVVNRADVQAFLADYAAGDADINGDDATTEADLRAFAACLRMDRDCGR